MQYEYPSLFDEDISQASIEHFGQDYRKEKEFYSWMVDSSNCWFVVESDVYNGQSYMCELYISYDVE